MHSGTQFMTASQVSFDAQRESSTRLAQRSATSSQKSTVHATASPQLGAIPPTQRPALQVSTPLQKKPSSQSASLVQSPTNVQPPGGMHWRSSGQRESSATCTQASATSSQASTVHATPSPQSGGVPAAQRPSTQRSAPSQKLPSSQSASPTQRVGGTQPPVGSHTKSPAHSRASGVFTQPPSASEHASIVHVVASSHSGGAPGTQRSSAQRSGPLQTKPSSHSASDAQGSMGTQPIEGEQSSSAPHSAWSGRRKHSSAASSQTSTVHAKSSLQRGGLPEMHVPPEQISKPLQKKPSSHSRSALQAGGWVSPSMPTTPASVGPRPLR